MIFKDLQIQAKNSLDSLPMPNPKEKRFRNTKMVSLVTKWYREKKKSSSSVRVLSENANSQVSVIYPSYNVNPSDKNNGLSKEPYSEDYGSSCFNGLCVSLPIEDKWTAEHIASLSHVDVLRISEDEELTLEISNDYLSGVGHLLIIVKKDVSASVRLKFKENKGALSQGIFLMIEENASLSFIFDEDSVHESSLFCFFSCLLEKGASLRSYLLLQGRGFVRLENRCILDNPFSSAELKSLIRARDGSRKELFVEATHSSPDTSCLIVNRSVLRDTSQASFQGTIRIDKASSRSSSFLDDKALLLSSEAIMDSIPSLEISSHEVSASHSSSIGKIDEEVLFYLASRGIPRETAKNMIIEGFVEEVIP